MKKRYTHRRVAWLLLKSRAKSWTYPDWWRQRAHHRDFVGGIAADIVSMACLAWCVVTSKPRPPITEVERRAVANACRRLRTKEHMP